MRVLPYHDVIWIRGGLQRVHDTHISVREVKLLNQCLSIFLHSILTIRGCLTAECQKLSMTYRLYCEFRFTWHDVMAWKGSQSAAGSGLLCRCSSNALDPQAPLASPQTAIWTDDFAVSLAPRVLFHLS